MKRFYYIDENEEEQLDLIWLLEYATDNKLNYDECVIALSRLEKHITITKKL